MVQTHTVQGDGGVRLAVREWRGEGPAILLLHGLASSSHIWDLVAPRLAPRFRVVVYDQRGHGRSGKPSSGYGFDRLIADAGAVIGTLGLGRPVVGGHSWGANVALQLAVDRAELVSGDVLVDGGFLSMRDRMDWRTARTMLAPPQLKEMSLQQFRAGMRTFTRGAVELTPEVEAVFLSLMRVDRDGNIHPRLSRANHLRILHALREQDAPGLLRRVRVPTLVLAVRSAPGEADSAGFMEDKERAAEVVKAIDQDVRFEWIDGIHDIPIQRPDAVAQRIQRFAQEVVG
ncbi:MAG: alpha/beta fold hydrolase [Actinomycetota bacterium]